VLVPLSFGGVFLLHCRQPGAQSLALLARPVHFGKTMIFGGTQLLGKGFPFGRRGGFLGLQARRHGSEVGVQSPVAQDRLSNILTFFCVEKMVRINDATDAYVVCRSTRTGDNLKYASQRRVDMRVDGLS
jgi:hypothetical protein